MRTVTPDACRAGCLTLAVGAACLLGTASTAGAGPRIDVRPDRINFGTMKPGERKRRVVRLRNAGDATLRIDQVRPSCAECIVDPIDVRSLAPGAGVDLPITFEAANVPGRQTAFVMLETNDPNTPLKRITITADVLPKGDAPRLELDRARLDAGVVLAGEPVTRRIEMRNTGQAPLLIRECTAGAAVSLGEKPVQRLPAGGKAILTLTIRSDTPGLLQSHVTIATNDPERSTRTVPVTGYVATAAQVARLMRGVSVTPERDAGPEGRLRAVRVTNYETTPVHAVGPASPGRRVRIGPGEAVTFEAGPAAGRPPDEFVSVEIVFPLRSTRPDKRERNPQ